MRTDEEILAEIRAQAAAEAQIDEPVEDDSGLSLSKISENFIPSGKRLLTDIASAVTSPVETGKTLLELADGVLDYAGIDLDGTSRIHMVNAVGDQLRERYGSVDKAIETVNTDPVGFFSDAAGLISGGAGLASKVPGLSKAAKIAEVANAVDPASVGLPIAGEILSRAKVPEGLYKSAAKFTNQTDADMATGAALEHGISPTRRGINKAQGLIDDRLAMVDELIAADATKSFELTDILTELETMKERATGPNAPALKAAIDRRITALLDDAAMTGKEALSGPELLAWRRAGDADIKRTRLNPSENDQVTEALTDISRRQLADAYPEVAAVNQELGPLIELRKGLEKKVPVMERANPFSLDTMVAVTADPASQGAALGMALANRPSIRAGGARLGQHLRDNGGLYKSLIQSSGQGARISEGIERAEESYIERLIKALKEQEEDD
jgi:hypothetical protein